MRATLFRTVLRILDRFPASLTSALCLQILQTTTGRAFGVRGAPIWFLPPGKALRKYAEFSVRCMESRRVELTRLYREAYRVGSRVRSVVGFTDRKDLERLVFYLYRTIGIVMEGELPGEVTVARCYFSRIYTPEQCRIMSNVDSGIVAGICGDGVLEFSARITEGCERCRACFMRKRED